MRSFLIFCTFISLASMSFAADTATGDTDGTATGKTATEQPKRKIAQAQITCGDDADAVSKQVSAAQSCYEANSIAQQCAYGSLADQEIVGSAIAVCQKAFAKKITSADKKAIATLEGRCAKKYAHSQGTMYVSFAMFCKLQVNTLFSDLYSPVE